MRHICVFELCFYFFLIQGQTRQLIRIFDFLFFFADWARVITIGATQPEQHCCLGHAPASQSHVAHTQSAKKQQPSGDGLRDSQTAMYIRTGLAPISDESAHNQGKKEKNLKNSYQVKQCSKKEKKQKHKSKTLIGRIFYFVLRMAALWFGNFRIFFKKTLHSCFNLFWLLRHCFAC